ncbi:unnamed protein product [Pseudo-nitzschia multistriata]|uniref:Protein kinase domain-containing protein n=1 Tax=Pseudo-nitzschia multistriata TaxID=183589 RepID=A0A448ZS11_9STRA|nr:unnamed protein product [Pseudo-nitzschia multistriata]
MNESAAANESPPGETPEPSTQDDILQLLPAKEEDGSKNENDVNGSQAAQDSPIGKSPEPSAQDDILQLLPAKEEDGSKNENDVNGSQAAQDSPIGKSPDPSAQDDILQLLPAKEEDGSKNENDVNGLQAAQDFPMGKSPDPSAQEDILQLLPAKEEDGSKNENDVNGSQAAQDSPIGKSPKPTIRKEASMQLIPTNLGPVSETENPMNQSISVNDLTLSASPKRSVNKEDSSQWMPTSLEPVLELDNSMNQSLAPLSERNTSMDQSIGINDFSFNASSVPSSLASGSFRSIMTKLKPVSEDFMAKLNESIRIDGSISDFSYSVNDSARGVSFDEVYDKEEILGEGAMAQVFRCVHRERNFSYAVKEVLAENYDSPDQDVKEEIHALKKLRDGPYILKLWDVFTGPDTTHLIMELMEGGDLLGILIDKGKFSESESRRISRKLLEAIFFCHKKYIVHRDIKLDNILISDRDSNDDSKIKLADFGCSRTFVAGEKGLKTLCGSPQYAAPELYMHEDGYDEKCDLWSAGICVFVLLGGYAPFDGEGMELRSVVCDGYLHFPSEDWEGISENAMNLIKSLIVVDPDERATVVEALDSEWLRRRDRESVLKYRNVNMDGSVSGTFDAWIKLQQKNGISLRKLPSDSYHSSHSELTDDMNNSCRSFNDEIH